MRLRRRCARRALQLRAYPLDTPSAAPCSESRRTYHRPSSPTYRSAMTTGRFISSFRPLVSEAERDRRDRFGVDVQLDVEALHDLLPFTPRELPDGANMAWLNALTRHRSDVGVRAPVQEVRVIRPDRSHSIDLFWWCHFAPSCQLRSVFPSLTRPQPPDLRANPAVLAESSACAASRPSGRPDGRHVRRPADVSSWSVFWPITRR